MVGTIVCWGFHERIFHFLTQPLRNAYPAVKFITTGPTEAFMMYVKMSFFVGIFLVAPYILYQVWAFIAPGLYSHEKAYAVPFIVAGSLFFLLGGGVRPLLPVPAPPSGSSSSSPATTCSSCPRWTSTSRSTRGSCSASDSCSRSRSSSSCWRASASSRAGFLMRQLKFAVLASFVISAVITPTADVVNQTMLALPIVGLYLLGVLVAVVFGRARRKPDDPTCVALADLLSQGGHSHIARWVFATPPETLRARSARAASCCAGAAAALRSAVLLRELELDGRADERLLAAGLARR